MIWGGYAMDEEDDEEELSAEEVEAEEEQPHQQKQQQSNTINNNNNNNNDDNDGAGTEQTNNVPKAPAAKPPRFEGKVAIITESSSGIDRATAVLLAKEGAKVTLHGTDEQELRRTVVQMIRADVDQDNILVVEGAIDNDQTLKNLVDRTYKKFGRIDILINNSGAGIRPAAHGNNFMGGSRNNSSHHQNGNGGANNNEDDDEDNSSMSSGSHGGGGGRGSSGGSANPFWRRSSVYRRHSSMFDDDGPSNSFDVLFNINLKSITKLTRLCVPYLEDTKGAVVNVSSFGGSQGFSEYSYFSTAKTALDNYCRSIAIKYAKRDIRVNNVNPGFITSETLEEGDSGVNKFYQNWIKNHVPMGRGGAAEEIAKVIAFLASDDASYVTGATIVADGALSIFSKPADFF